PLARKRLILKTRRDVRVVEGARLESVCRRNSTEGSNPSLSAIPACANPKASPALRQSCPTAPAFVLAKRLPTLELLSQKIHISRSAFLGSIPEIVYTLITHRARA